MEVTKSAGRPPGARNTSDRTVVQLSPERHRSMYGRAMPADWAPPQVAPQTERQQAYTEYKSLERTIKILTHQQEQLLRFYPDLIPPS
jgi:hypothetical protein